MKKSEKFLNRTYNSLVSFYDGDGSMSDSDISDGNTLTYVRDIFELIKANKFDDLQSYINDDVAVTPNKNYTYRLRDKISLEISNQLEFIKEIENDD